MITGRSAKPVYLSILHGEPALRPAGHLMGKGTGQVEELIKSELGDARIEVMQCGPSAEKGVPFVRGKERVSVADSQGLKALSKSEPGLMAGTPDVEDLGKSILRTSFCPRTCPAHCPPAATMKGCSKVVNRSAGK